MESKRGVLISKKENSRSLGKSEYTLWGERVSAIVDLNIFQQFPKMTTRRWGPVLILHSQPYV